MDLYEFVVLFSFGWLVSAAFNPILTEWALDKDSGREARVSDKFIKGLFVSYGIAAIILIYHLITFPGFCNH